MLKVKQRRTADCVAASVTARAAKRWGSLLLGLYDRDGKLDHVVFTSTIANEDRAGLTTRLEALISSPGFTGKVPGGQSRWRTERTAEWQPLNYDQVTGNRFRHGTKLLRFRPDKAPRQCTFQQIAQPARQPRPFADMLESRTRCGLTASSQSHNT